MLQSSEVTHAGTVPNSVFQRVLTELHKHYRALINVKLIADKFQYLKEHL